MPKLKLEKKIPFVVLDFKKILKYAAQKTETT